MDFVFKKKSHPSSTYVSLRYYFFCGCGLCFSKTLQQQTEKIRKEKKDESCNHLLFLRLIYADRHTRSFVHNFLNIQLNTFVTTVYNTKADISNRLSLGVSLKL